MPNQHQYVLIIASNPNVAKYASFVSTNPRGKRSGQRTVQISKDAIQIPLKVDYYEWTWASKRLVLVTVPTAVKVGNVSQRLQNSDFEAIGRRLAGQTGKRVSPLSNVQGPFTLCAMFHVGHDLVGRVGSLYFGLCGRNAKGPSFRAIAYSKPATNRAALNDAEEQFEELTRLWNGKISPSEFLDQFLARSSVYTYLDGEWKQWKQNIEVRPKNLLHRLKLKGK